MGEPELQPESDPKMQKGDTVNKDAPWVAKFLLKMGKGMNGASRWFVTFPPPISYFTDPIAFGLDLIGGAAQASALWIAPDLEDESRKEKGLTAGLRAAAGVVGLVGAIGIVGAGAVVAAPILIVAGAFGVFVSNCISYFRARKEYKETLAAKPKGSTALDLVSPEYKLWEKKCEAKEQQKTTTALGVACSFAALAFGSILLAGLSFTFPIVAACILGAGIGIVAGYLGREAAIKQANTEKELAILETHVIDKKGIEDRKALKENDVIVMTETPKEMEAHFTELKTQYLASGETWPPKDSDHLFDPLETEQAKHSTQLFEKIADPKKEDKTQDKNKQTSTDKNDDRGEDKLR